MARRWRSAFVVSFLSALLLATGEFGWPFLKPEQINARAIDGDTLLNRRTGQRIRLINVYAPEVGDRAQCAAERQAGERATRATQAFIAEGEVFFKSVGREDVYGRALGHVRVNDVDLGAHLIKSGFAKRWAFQQSAWCRGR